MLATSTASAEPVEYRIDPEHLSLGFLVDHIGYASVLGFFRNAEGSLEFDEGTGVVTNLRVAVDSASVFTNHDKRDDHLRSADFLNSTEFPEMVFTAERADPLGDQRYQISGNLELLGQSRPLTLDATLNKVGEYPFGGGLLSGKPYVIGVSARGSFERSGYGMNYGVDNGWVGNEINLIIEFEAVRQ
jgi:polyisoprenoid-binding protein YceI